MATSSFSQDARDVSPDMFTESSEGEHCESSQSWRGSTMEQIYNNQGIYDWNPEPIHASNDHQVMFTLPIPETGPPKPREISESYCWHSDHVRMPFAKQNLYPVSNGQQTILKNRWSLIKDALSQPINTSEDLQERIFAYNNRYADRWDFSMLHYFFNDVLDEAEREYFFENIMPNIVQLALRLPELLPSSVPLLKKGKTKAISLTQLQIASILANAFLCTFPRRNTHKQQSEYGTYPFINFNRFFHAQDKRASSNCNKLKCIFNYFRRVTTSSPDGVVTFQRRYINPFDLPQWRKSDQPLSTLRLHIDNKGTIEKNGKGLLQVDFANKFIGGGVIGSGCVQEEIRFVECPELIASCLFTEELDPTEALLITGVEQYNASEGYSDTFTWSGDYRDTTPRDAFRRRKCYLVAIDATHFWRPTEQYNMSKILRELNKAYVGYYSPTKDKPIPAIATGNWGCGAFRGDPYLKSLLQMMACRLAGRDIVYYTFGNYELSVKLDSLFTELSENNVTIGNLYECFIKFSESKLPGKALYPFILQNIKDNGVPDMKPLTHYFLKKRRKVNSPKEKLKNVGENIVVDELFDSAFLDIDISPPQTPPPATTDFLRESMEMNCNTISSSASSSVGDSILLAKIQEMERNELAATTSTSTKSNSSDTDKMDVDGGDKLEDNSVRKNNTIKRKISDYFKK